MNNLTILANKYNCDKGTEAGEAHSYTEEYPKYIPQFSESKQLLLIEIGVYHCDSMRMWNEYNPELQIVGLDIDKDILNYYPEEDKDKYSLYIGNATDSEFINKVLEDNLPDFIIDDGSHNYMDILSSFRLLYPKLKEGGYYFIEDLHASYAEKYKLIADITSEYTFKNLGFRCNDKLWIIQKT